MDYRKQLILKEIIGIKKNIYVQNFLHIMNIKCSNNSVKDLSHGLNVSGFNSDIICLQEVDKSVYEYDLLPSLDMLNYDGTFVTKNEISEGLATFFYQERFEKIGYEFTVMSQNIDFPRFAEIWSKIKNEKTKERFLGRNTTVQVFAYSISFISMLHLVYRGRDENLMTI